MGWLYLRIMLLTVTSLLLSQSRTSLCTKFGPCILEHDQSVYAVVPGVGWDNLRNIEMARVYKLHYDDCYVSEDGKFLLPSGVTLTPVKQSQVDLDSQTFEHFQNYTSMTAASINLDGSGEIEDVGISGRFSMEHQTVKAKQMDTKSVITRTRLSYQMYTATIQPDSELTTEFKKRLFDMASRVLAENSSSSTDSTKRRLSDVDYLADLLVRDFGTHVLTAATSGATLSKVDHLDHKFVEEMSTRQDALRYFASASFMKLFNMSMGMAVTVSDTDLQSYESNTSHSTVQSLGGPPLRANVNLTNWLGDLMNNLVAVDRMGDPLFYAITPRSLPDLPEMVVYKVAARVKAAVNRYYRHNALRGCLNLHSPNFNENANIDSGDCTQATVNFTLGGVFQICSGPQSICQKVEQKNPATGTFSCDQALYDPVELYSGDTHRCEEHCVTTWYVVFTRVTCTTQCATLHTFWCAPRHGTEGSSEVKGFMLGGVYSPEQVNPVTNDRSCPPHYFGVNLGLVSTLCVSADVELGADYQLTFGGFYSCTAGNPLAVAPSPSGSSSNNTQLQARYKSVWDDSAVTKWPARCSVGFTPHLAYMDNSCEVLYCLRNRQFMTFSPQHVRRPPFVRVSQYALTMGNRSLHVTQLVDTNSQLWVKDSNTTQWRRVSYVGEENESHTAHTISSQGNPWVVTVLAVAFTMVFCLVLIGSVRFMIKKYQKGKLERHCLEMNGVTDSIEGVKIN